MATAVPIGVKTFVDLLTYRAEVQPDALAFRFLSYSADSVEEDTITFKALDTRARLIAKQLLSTCQPGDRALMLYPSGIDFIAAYFGCLYAGVIAVPGYPPKRNQKLGRLKSLMQSCQAKVAMTDRQTQQIAEPQFGEVDELKSLAWVITDAIEDTSLDGLVLPKVRADDIAFLQYTSGSTGDPKGVMVSHGNLLANSRSIYAAMGHGPDTVFVGWLPLFHDMGLIGNVLQPIYAGIPSTLMAPASFLQRPMRWLEAITKYKATTSGGPNFGYDLCVNSIKDEDLAQLDLSSWRIAFNGAEPIRPETLHAFSKKFAACGFKSSSHYACYGMAETTLIITGAQPGIGTRTTYFDDNQLQQKRAVAAIASDPSAHELVSCGKARCEQGVVIVNPETLSRCADGEVGEIWAFGHSNAEGYWQRADATEETFAAYTSDTNEGPYLRTGDLGFLYQGELYIAGRLKDVVIIRGANHYPQDIELTAFESHEAFMPNGAAVFTVEEDGQEQLIIVLEVRRTHVRSFDAEALARALQEAVVLQHELQVRSIVFIKQGQLPKTSSGKVQRQGCKRQFLNHEIEEIARIDKSSDVSLDDVMQFDRLTWIGLPETEKIASAEEYLASLFEAYAKLPAGTMQRDVAFIGYGLDSLALTQIAARIRDTFGLSLMIKDLFIYKTVRSLATYLSGQDAAAVPALPAISKRTEQGRILLSLDQKPYWFLHQLEGGSSTYNTPAAIRLHGSLDLDALEKSFQSLIDRHEAVRTLFPIVEGEPFQQILPYGDFKLPVVLASEDEVEGLLQADFTYVFDLEHEIPIRVRLLKIDDAHHIVSIVAHHIAFDGWSLNVLIQEMTELYSSYCVSGPNPLPALQVQYGDYSQWQHENVVGDYYNRQIAFWKQKLDGLAPLLNLPQDYSRPPAQSYRGKEVPIKLPANLTEKLHQYAMQHNTTLYNLLMSGLAILLSRYGRTGDIPIGTAVANRLQKEVEPLVGCFANTLVVRCRVNPAENFEQLITAVGNETLDAFSNSSVPFDGVVEAVQPQRSLGVPPVFQVMFRLHTQQTRQSSTFAGLRSELFMLPTQNAKLDLNFSLVENENGLNGVIEFATDIFSEQTVTRIAKHYQTILEAAMAKPTVAIEKLSVLTQEEMEQVREWNSTKIDYPKDECMHHLFEQTVERTPEKLAYVCGGDRFTYAELNARANKLAHFLQSKGVGPEVRVGVSVERSQWAALGALAAFKSGGTYVPLDVNYPKDRIERMLEVAKPRIILTLTSVAPLFAGCDAEVICLDTAWESMQSLPDTNPAKIGADHSAYILFTSGTTGKPKGILVAHKSFRNMAVAQKWAGLHTSDSRILQFASLSFSISLWGAFMAWVPGGTLYSVTAKQALPDEPLYDFLEESQVTHVTWPVSMLSTLPVHRMPKSLRTVISSAEPCNDAVVEKWTAHGVRFLNLYGNSEVSIGSTLYEYKQVGEKLTIGKAFPNTQMYLLDEHLQQVPIGVIAEIHTAGVGLATCYVDDPVATAKSFIPNPFGTSPTERMYKTGDLGRYLPNGEIEFIGREDFQVSIRGFRVELTEIEDVLRAIPGVLEAVVNSRDDQQGLARLVCFYTLTQDASAVNAAMLRKTVSEKLPNYMVPSLFIQLDAMPLTPNRKIDRLALQGYPIEDSVDEQYVAPKSKLEKQLAEIWSAVLGIQDIGVRQDFFELGGHSLLATKIVARIRADLQIELSLQQFFEHSTIERLAVVIEQANSRYLENPIRILENRDKVPLSFAQQRMWFLDRYEENSTYYHIPGMLKIVGELDVDALNKTFVTIIERHEALRTNFITDQGQGYQTVHPSIDWTMEVVELQGSSEEEKQAQLASHIDKQLHTSFNLETDALMRVALYKLSDREYRLFVNMHHIIGDGWSVVVLLNEITTLYTAYVNKAAPQLKELPVQYADFTVSQIEYLQGPVITKQGDYWNKKLNELTTISLPLDFERPGKQTYNGAHATFEIDKPLYAALEELSNQQGVTLFMTMLSAFKTVLHKYSGDTDICIGTPIANRTRPELEPLIGFFANTLTLRSDLGGDPTFAALLQQVKQTTLEAYSNQDIPFEKVVDLVLKERDPSRTPLFQVSFGLQNNLWPTRIDLPGVQMNFVALENKTSKFDMHMEFRTSSEGDLDGTIEFNTDLFKPESIRTLIAAFNNLLREIVANPVRKLSELSLSDNNDVLRDSIKLQDYPVLEALYASTLTSENHVVDYILLDETNRPTQTGEIGKLYFDIQSRTDVLDRLKTQAKDVQIGNQIIKLVPTGFTARRTWQGLTLLSSADDVALIDNHLVYPRLIERQLMTRSDIQDCHVAIRHHAELGDQVIVYMVCDSDEPDTIEVTQFLQEARFVGFHIFACVKVGAIPLTRHGKVNLKQLQRYAVHNQATRQAWSDTVSLINKVKQAVVVPQVVNEQQPVSHLLDLLPANARGLGGSVETVINKSKKVGGQPVSTVPAIFMSEPIVDVLHRPMILSDMLINAAQRQGDKTLEFYHADNSTASITYAELKQKAQCVLSGLRAAGLDVGSKVIFQFDRNEDFIVSFWACQLGGYIPVPIAAAKTYRTSNPQTVKIAHAWKLMDNAIILAGGTIYEGVCNIAKLEAVDDLVVHDISTMADEAPAQDFYRGATDDVALIMLTSGSTGLPKGVQLTHANLIGRTLGSAQLNGFQSGMVSLNWMALDHVGGIIYFHIRDTYLGAVQIQADTEYILADPLRWLRLIDQHRVNVTWAPNFAFALVVDRQEELKKLSLDLSSMQFMLNGAEAVVPKTTQAFIDLMQPFGMPPDSVKPVYGMSEISSGVTYSKRLQLTYGSDDTVFVSVGRTIPGVNMRIVDENDELMVERQSGRLQISGVTVTKGYLGGEAVNKDVYTQDGWFKTGDLAFIQNGELTITGREKDIIIINGVNFYSHEIAEVVETVQGVVVSYTGACAVRRSGSNSDQLAIFFNTALKGDALLALIKQIRLAVIEKVGINPSFIVPVEKDQVPKTEIGKIQLAKLAQAFNRGGFDHALRSLDLAERNDNTLPDWSFSKTWVQKPLSNLVNFAPAGTTLVFADHSGCAAALGLADDVIMVTQGSAFQDRGNTFNINPSMREHYFQLVAALAQRSITVTRVVNLWDYESIVRSADALLTKATLSDAIGLYSGWFLAQAFADLPNSPAAMRWIWAARKSQRVGEEDIISPDKAAALALLKTLPKEFSWIKWHHVDFAGNQAAEHAEQLKREILSFHPSDEVAYRDGKRLVVRLRKERRVVREKREMPLKVGGAYMISGGLGGIGYELAKMLLKQFNAKLLLVGRTSVHRLSAERKDMLDHLSGMGSVVYSNADICDFKAVESAVDNAESDWKQKLNGVFHLAGLPHEEAMAKQSIHSLHDVLRAKTSGTRVLYNICNRRTGTLFVNFSSVNGFFGSSGMAAYNIGNRYQEAFVESVRNNKNVHSLCISWSIWHDTGMGSQYKHAESLSKALGFTPIKPGKGLFSLLTVLYHGRRNVLIGLDDTKPNVRHLVTGVKPRDQQLVCYFAANEPGITNDVAASVSLTDAFGLPLSVQYMQVEALPMTDSGVVDIKALRTMYAQAGTVKAERIAPRDELEETLVKIATTVFEASEPIGIKDNFFDVGATSLLIVKLHHEIQQQLDVQFPMVELFNSTTIEKLASFIGQLGDKTQTSTADAARNVGLDRRAAMQRRNRSRDRKAAR
jgi:amino acid adenylation domain-containing protein